MQSPDRQLDYWRRNLGVTLWLLTLWFVVTFVFTWFARELNTIEIIGPVGFYLGAQGAVIIYVLIIWYYGNYMNSLDKEYAEDEDEGG